jgi:tetratricopeptide (TPR) repeat protein
MGNNVTNANKFWTLCQKAETRRQEEDYDLAIYIFNEALEIPGFENSYWALSHRAETYRQEENYSAAQKDFEAAIATKPDYIWGLAHLAETHYCVGEYQKALEYFNQAIELSGGKYAWALAHRGQVLRLYDPPKGSHASANENWRQALADFQAAEKQDPQYAWAIAYQAVMHALLEEYKEAWRALERAIRIDPHIMEQAIALLEDKD